MQPVFNTKHIPAHERFPSWTQAVCQTFLPVDCRRRGKVPLHGEMKRIRLDDLELVEIITPAMDYSRGPKELAKNHGDGVFVLSLNLSGKGGVIPSNAHARRFITAQFDRPIHNHLSAADAQDHDGDPGAADFATDFLCRRCPGDFALRRDGAGGDGGQPVTNISERKAILM